ncbi:unnamed protein product [Ranitomeya imitator]|uniref:Centrosome and spindle pole-associated protein 1 C-terminal domain-containing protein n=1 Tax=Ranitomeya imitator TaxID=111125 RepID=A0ABN9MIF9_9NEOB|nr:unnamed protein product [Ranitomeya imitator]
MAQEFFAEIVNLLEDAPWSFPDRPDLLSQAPTHPLDLVRAVRISLASTAAFRKMDSLFAIPYGARRGLPASKATIARWIRTAILEAYRQRQKNEELVRLADERRKEAERKRKEEEAKHEEEMKRLYEQDRAVNVNEEQERPPRQLSPVIPALQHKLSSRTQRPPTAESVASVQSHGESHSRTGSPPVPARRNQLRAYDEKKSVISELTELRKQLRSEQRRLEGRLQDTEQDNESLPSMSGRRKEKTSTDVFDLARLKLQATVRRPSLKGPENVNMQNIRDFNNLKYRDTDTREGVRIMFPDPPRDDQTLEIQQQALLREQQKNLNKIKRRAAIPDDFGQVPAYSLHRPGMLSDQSKDLLKTSLLESESAFIGFPEGYRVNSHTCSLTIRTMSTACTATPYPHRSLNRTMILAHKRAQKSGPGSVPHPLAHQSLSVAETRTSISSLDVSFLFRLVSE